MLLFMITMPELILGTLLIFSLLALLLFGSLLVWDRTEASFFQALRLPHPMARVFYLLVGYILLINLALIQILKNHASETSDQSTLIFFFDYHSLNVLSFLTVLFLCFLIFAYYHPSSSHSSLNFELPLLLFFAYLGMVFLILNRDFFSWFLSLELQSFSFFALAGFRSRRSFLQSEASLRYFIFAGLASVLFLFGLSMVYAYYGTIDLYAILSLILFEEDFTFLGLGLVGIFLALLFKLGVAPFHIWLPEVYHGVSSLVTFFFFLMPKISLLYNLFIFLQLDIQVLLDRISFSSIFLSLAIGSFMAFNQTNFKKFFAYSSIFNNAFFLLPLINAKSSFSFFSLFFFLFSYQLSLFLVFFPFLFLRSSQDLRLINNLRDLLSLKKVNPVLSFIFTCSLFSLAGIPPFIGFFAKLFLFLGALDQGYLDLIFLFLVFSVLSTYYYIRLVKIIFFSFLLRNSWTKPLPLWPTLLTALMFTVLSFLSFLPLYSLVFSSLSI